MPDAPWLVERGRIETCRTCDRSFRLVAGESTSVLTHRYTAWRDEHDHPSEDASGEASADASPVTEGSDDA